jgi:hypothetical protein
MQRVSTTGKTADVDLSPFEFSFANTANPLIIERVPSPRSITSAQDRQAIIEFDMINHGVRRILGLVQKQTIGEPDDRVIGQNPTRQAALIESARVQLVRCRIK